MRRPFFFLLFIILLSGGSLTWAQATASAPKPVWSDALAAARLADKLILVDVYTTWCGPCRRMDNEVFTDSAVSKTINTNFISFKLDAEKGEGPALSERYQVVSYPTYLFVNGNGTLVYKVNGYTPVPNFIKEMTNALEEQKAPVTLLQMDSVYITKKTDTSFLYAYLKKRRKTDQDNGDLLNDYVALLDSSRQNSLPTLQLIADNGTFGVGSLETGTALAVLLHNKQRLHLLKNTEDPDNYIYLAQQNTIKKAILLKDEQLLQSVIVLNGQRNHELYDDDCDDMLKLSFYYNTAQYQKFRMAATLYLDGKLMTIPDSVMQRKDKAALDEETNALQTGHATKSDAERASILARYKRVQSIQLINAFYKIDNWLLTADSSKKMINKELAWSKHSLFLAGRDTAYFKYVYPPCLHIYAQYLYRAGKKRAAITYQAKAARLIAVGNIADSAEEITAYRELLTNWQKGK